MFDDLIDRIGDDEFEERPVALEEFLYGKEYLGLDITLSQIQFEIITAMTQIYKKETLERLYGTDKGEHFFKKTYNEIICQLGKGSGKDAMSVIACTYVVYQLLCLRSPAQYFGKPEGDTIDIINIAINAVQANNVFFAGFKNRINRSKWFQGKFVERRGHFEFDKSVNVYSGNSEAEAWEGFNCGFEDAEALTRNGWKRYDEIFVGDEIYTLNHITGAGEWNVVEHMLIKEVKEDLVEYSSNWFYSLTTKDHRWATVNSDTGERVWKTSDTLDETDLIPIRPTSVREFPTEKKYSDALVSVAAWYITGALAADTVIDDVRSIVADRTSTFDFVNSLTEYQLRLFADVFQAGITGRLSQEQTEILGYALILLGEAVAYSSDTPGVTLRNSEFDSPQKPLHDDDTPQKKLVPYEGIVWCPTVKNGTWLTREKGSVHFTGNCIFVVLDEISGFALDLGTARQGQQKTASSIFKMYSASVASRFPDYGKVILLSFPRFKDDFIQQRYDQMVLTKDIIKKTHTFTINPEIPKDAPGNSLTIEWDEDHITGYRMPRVFAIKRPSWDVNPTRKIEDYLGQFIDDKADALGRFACMPSEAINGFFKDHEKIDMALRGTNGVDDSGVFYPWFKPESDVTYYVHVDLAQKHDRCAVAMSHVAGWQQREIGGKRYEPSPVVVTDVVRWWTPTKATSVDLTEVREFIVSLVQRGFNVGLVTFDRWQSHDMQIELRNRGILAETLSVGKKHYTELSLMIHEERVSIPNISLLSNELKSLILTRNDKVEHQRNTSKDLSDAMCGSVFNAMSYAERGGETEIDVVVIDQFKQKPSATQNPSGVIGRPLDHTAPTDIAEFLAIIGG